ncbi:PREDICTED: protein phosphatase 1 regulatory subunit 3C-B-like [Cyprinodon variegatus]|uniref:Protein phosphatase 1 regulatory subunit n=1 Tax=Cyprinodon variegatus TaxID=28743 RepID=A0A3Q2EI81_CYPVA|nr:PREDICTED: protein phosphatase 1 regulatory subunit 3C-B-like [Cyprinodon variegatus]
MPVDMAFRICLASSPPPYSFLSNHDKHRYTSATVSPSCQPLRSCLSSGCCSPVSLETPAPAENVPQKKILRKSVVFADSQGLALTTVHVYNEEEDDFQAELQFHLTELEDATEALCLEDVKDSEESGSGLVLDFTPPSTDYLDLRNRLKAQQVCLETCAVKDHFLSGTIQVRNICYEKSVLIRITFDSWSSFQDIKCQYLNNVYGCPDTDTFSFSVSVPQDMVSSTGVEFCIKYQTSDHTYWDNNLGNNYRLMTADPTGCQNWILKRSVGQEIQRHGSTHKTDKMEFDPFGSPRTSAGIFPEWQSWGRVETSAPYW